jgi:uncharacterized protein (DUF58 family)
VRLRKRAVGLASGAAVLFLMGTNVQAGWLLVLCALLLGTIISGVVLPGRMLRGIEVERRAPAEVVQGEEAFVELVVTNRARGAKLGLTFDDPHVSPTSLYVAHVRPGERIELVTVRRALKRGVHDASAVTLRSAAPFGVAERRRTLQVAGSTTVLPAVVPLGPLPFLAPESDPERALRSVSRRGTGPEFLGIREYRPGDSPRHVHWPSTARAGTVMVRELEQERSRRIAIVIDTLTDVGDAGTPLDACCAAAASIARVAFTEGHRVRFVESGPGITVEVSDDVDDGSFRRRLAVLMPDGVALSEVLDRGADAFRDVDVVVVFVPTWRSNGDAPLGRAIGTLAATGTHVAAIAVEVGSHDARRVAALRAEEIDGFITTLDDAGADTYLWRSGSNLADVLTEARAVVG